MSSVSFKLTLSRLCAGGAAGSSRFPISFPAAPACP